jgi:hypothetical protein
MESPIFWDRRDRRDIAKLKHLLAKIAEHAGQAGQAKTQTLQNKTKTGQAGQAGQPVPANLKTKNDIFFRAGQGGTGGTGLFLIVAPLYVVFLFSFGECSNKGYPCPVCPNGLNSHLSKKRHFSSKTQKGA